MSEIKFTDEDLLDYLENNDFSKKSDADQFLVLAEQQLLDSIDDQVGAPFDVRAQVMAAQSPEDRLNTLRKFYPDAIPVGVLSPQFGEQRFGRNNFVYTDPETGNLTLFDECSKVDISYKDIRFNDSYNTKPSETISISFHMDYLGFFGYEQKSTLLFDQPGDFNYGS